MVNDIFERPIWIVSKQYHVGIILGNKPYIATTSVTVPGEAIEAMTHELSYFGNGVYMSSKCSITLVIYEEV